MKITFECASVAEVEELRAFLNEKAGHREEQEPVKALAGEAAEAKPEQLTLEELIDEYTNFPDERKGRKKDMKEDGEA